MQHLLHPQHWMWRVIFLCDGLLVNIKWRSYEKHSCFFFSTVISQIEDIFNYTVYENSVWENSSDITGALTNPSGFWERGNLWQKWTTRPVPALHGALPDYWDLWRSRHWTRIDICYKLCLYVYFAFSSFPWDRTCKRLVFTSPPAPPFLFWPFSGSASAKIRFMWREVCQTLPRQIENSHISYDSLFHLLVYRFVLDLRDSCSRALHISADYLCNYSHQDLNDACMNCNWCCSLNG